MICLALSFPGTTPMPQEEHLKSLLWALVYIHGTGRCMHR